MEDRTLHPSMKSVWASYLLAIAIALAGMWAIHQYATDPAGWVYLIPLVVLLPPLNMQLNRRMLTLRFHDGHLTLETGLLSRTRRTVDVAKIQDVTVQQSLGQRIMGTGDLMLESAGESGAMSFRNLDSPREIADDIIASSKAAQALR
jgi:uncharacterized membrane protein YdbT with pleckstrin-like domain